MGKKLVLLVNLGTPRSPRIRDVRRYLTEFLNDPRVIGLPAPARLSLVNLIIVPFRAPKSAGMYRKIWTAEGSPILIHSENLATALQLKLGSGFRVELAMRYGKPSLAEVLGTIRLSQPQSLLVVPLFPQYASATTGSILEKVLKITGKWHVLPEIRTIPCFHHEEAWLKASASLIRSAYPEKADHVVFSFHGLPVKQVTATHPGYSCEELGCDERREEINGFCYRAQCSETARSLAARLGLQPGTYSVTYQSRFGKNWLRPFTDERLRSLAAEGKKKVLVASPSFTADCLETIDEIGVEYRKLFLGAGGEELLRVPSLNDHPEWVNGLAEMVLGRLRD